MTPTEAFQVRMQCNRAIARSEALELKLPRRRQSPPQAAWAAVVRAQGGFYAVARTIPEAQQAVARCREGRSE